VTIKKQFWQSAERRCGAVACYLRNGLPISCEHVAHGGRRARGVSTFTTIGNMFLLEF